jgi:hypothetical protein
MHDWGVLLPTNTGPGHVLHVTCMAPGCIAIMFHNLGTPLDRLLPYFYSPACHTDALSLHQSCRAWKCMIGESCDPLTQGQVMSYMSLAWGLGCIAGPSIGGLLSQPCNSWPGMAGCSDGGLLRARWVAQLLRGASCVQIMTC